MYIDFGCRGMSKSNCGTCHCLTVGTILLPPKK
ncbi:hypothetical protein BGM25_03555 [Bacillus sp. FJAT-29953]|nr:hypothetical protein [Bacillus sp. FJAT-29953]